MANYREDILDIDLKGGNINRGWLNHTIGAGDEKANRFGVRVFRDKQPVILTGTCIGLFRRADNETVPISHGVISGNVAYVTLPKECYVVEGVFSLAIKVTATDNTITLRIVDGMVDNTGTEVYVDPGTILPDIEDLINSINAAVEDIPLDYSALSNGFRDSMLEAFGTSAPGTWVSYTIKRLDGTLDASSVYKTTGFIPVTGGEVLFTTSPAVNATVLATRATIAFYSTNDASGYISSEPFEEGTPATLLWRSAKVPAGATHMRITIEATLTEQFKCSQVYTIADTLRYTQQTLTAAEKEQARQNIGVDLSAMFLNGYILPDGEDLNDIDKNSVVFVQSGAAHIPDHYPDAFGTDAAIIITMLDTSNANFRSQMGIRNLDGAMMFRSLVGTGWRDWKAVEPMGGLMVRSQISSFGETGDEYGSLADLPENSFFRTYNAPDRPDGQAALAGFWVLTLKTEGASYWLQIGFGASTGIAVMRYKSTGSYSEWMPLNGKKKQIKMLCIGNSYTQDNMSYVPFLMQRLCPDIELTMGISHYSGAKIDDYIGFFENNTRVLMYSKIGPYDTAWTTWGTNTTTVSDNQKTIKEILADEAWDIVTIQQGSGYMASWSTFSNLNEWIDDIMTYLRSQGLRKVRLGWLMPQMRKPLEYTSQNYTYANMIDCVQQVVATSPVSFVIPCGTAIENARHTSLDSLGSYASEAPDSKGHLCYDNQGHLQEGLPCLCGAYAAVIKLMELAGEPYGILAENTWPNDDWRSGKNIPIPHGSAVGMNATSLYMAQKCAVAANKKPYEVTEIT